MELALALGLYGVVLGLGYVGWQLSHLDRHARAWWDEYLAGADMPGTPPQRQDGTVDRPSSDSGTPTPPSEKDPA